METRHFKDHKQTKENASLEEKMNENASFKINFNKTIYESMTQQTRGNKETVINFR